VLAPEDLTTEDGAISCSLVIQGRGVGIARHAYSTLVRFFVELL
jgi:hypothetical protein